MSKASKRARPARHADTETPEQARRAEFGFVTEDADKHPSTGQVLTTRRRRAHRLDMLFADGVITDRQRWAGIRLHNDYFAEWSPVSPIDPHRPRGASLADNDPIDDVIEAKRRYERVAQAIGPIYSQVVCDVAIHQRPIEDVVKNRRMRLSRARELVIEHLRSGLGRAADLYRVSEGS